MLDGWQLPSGRLWWPTDQLWKVQKDDKVVHRSGKNPLFVLSRLASYCKQYWRFLLSAEEVDSSTILPFFPHHLLSCQFQFHYLEDQTCHQYLHSFPYFQHQYTSALFWADKVASFSKGKVSCHEWMAEWGRCACSFTAVVLFSDDTEDIYSMAQCLYLTRQYHRAAHCIQSRNLHKASYVKCQHLWWPESS